MSWDPEQIYVVLLSHSFSHPINTSFTTFRANHVCALFSSPSFHILKINWCIIELHLPMGWNGASAQQCAVAVYCSKWLPHPSEITKCFRSTGSRSLSENLARKPQLNAYHLKKCINKPQTPALSPFPKPHHKFLMFTSGLELSFLFGVFCGIWDFGPFVFLVCFFKTQNAVLPAPQYWPTNCTPSTSSWRARFDTHSCHQCYHFKLPLLLAWCHSLHSQGADTDTCTTAERLRRGSCSRSCHNKTRTHR